jgi:putative transposase
MPRKPRIFYPGALYHCLNRGNRRDALFQCEEDYSFMLDCLAQAVDKMGFSLHGYCLMPNHLHLIIQSHQVHLSSFMRSCLTRYAQQFNRKYHISGHVFQGRYRAILCQKDAYLLELVRYVHLNPVRAHLVGTPQQWRWSSLNDYLQTHPPSWLYTQDVLSFFGSQPRQHLLSFLSQSPCLDSKQIYSQELFPLLGDEPFIQTVTSSRPLRRQIPRSFPGPRLSLQQIATTICENESIPISLILTHQHKGSRRLTQIRQQIILAASHLFYYPAVQIAHFLQISPPAVTRLQILNQKTLRMNTEREAQLIQMFMKNS